MLIDRNECQEVVGSSKMVADIMQDEQGLGMFKPGSGLQVSQPRRGKTQKFNRVVDFGPDSFHFTYNPHVGMLGAQFVLSVDFGLRCNRNCKPWP